MKPDPKLQVKPQVFHPKFMDGIVLMSDGLVEQAHQLTDGLKPIMQDVAVMAEHQKKVVNVLTGMLKEIVDEWMADNGYDLDEIVRVTKGNEHSDVEARVFFVRKDEKIDLVQAGIVNLQVNEDGKIATKNVRFTRSWLSIGGGEPFKISTGAQSKLLGFFFKDTRTIKERSFPFDYVIEKIEKQAFVIGSKQDRYNTTKRYYSARRYLNSTVRSSYKVKADLITYDLESKRIQLNLSIVEK